MGEHRFGGSCHRPWGSGWDRTGCLSLSPSPRWPQPLPAPRAEPRALGEGETPSRGADAAPGG